MDESNHNVGIPKSSAKEESVLKVEDEHLSEYNDASVDATNVILAAGTGVAVSLSASGVGLGMGITVLALTVVATQINSVIEQNLKLIDFMPSLFLAINSLYIGMSMNGVKANFILKLKSESESENFIVENEHIVLLLEKQIQWFITNTISLSIALLCAMPDEMFIEFNEKIRPLNCIFYDKIFDEVETRRANFGHTEFFIFIRAFSANDLSTTFQKQLLIIQSNVTTISLLLEEIEMLLSNYDGSLYQRFKNFVKENTKSELNKVAPSLSSKSVDSAKSVNETSNSLKGDFNTTNESGADETFCIYGFNVSFKHANATTIVEQIAKLKENANQFKDMSVKFAQEATTCLDTVSDACVSVNNTVASYIAPELFILSAIKESLSQMYPGRGGRRRYFQTKKRNKNRKTKQKRDVINNKKHTRFTKHNRFTKRN
jgi:hypothetical protein